MTRKTIWWFNSIRGRQARFLREERHVTLPGRHRQEPSVPHHPSTLPVRSPFFFRVCIFLIVSHRTAGSTREPFKTNNWIYNYTLLNFWFDFEFDCLLSTIFHYLVMIREFNQLISYDSFVIEKAEGPPEASRPRVRKAPPKFYSLPHNKIAEVFLFFFALTLPSVSCCLTRVLFDFRWAKPCGSSAQSVAIRGRRWLGIRTT